MFFVRLIAITGFLAVMATGITSAVIIEFDLQRMVDESKLIVVGRVVKIVEVPEAGPFGNRATATVEVDATVKGPVTTSVEIEYYPHLSIDATLEIRARYVIFIRPWNGMNFVVQGYAGATPIHGDKVEVEYILGEQKHQALSDFVQRIRDKANVKEDTLK